MPRNPPWVVDELLVVLAVYLAERRVLEETHPRVIEASRLLNALPIHEEAGHPGFRTPDAVVLRLANYRSLDPTTNSRGMTNGGRAAEDVWNRFAGDSETVTNLVEAIASSVQNATSDLISEEQDEDVVPEGRLIYRTHRRRERSAGLRKRKLAAIRSTGERPRCEACGLDPQSLFGADAGVRVLECHHLDPLSLGERQTRLSEVVLLCANCHRAIHGLGLSVEPRELAARLPTSFVDAMRAAAAEGLLTSGAASVHRRRISAS